MHGKLLFDKMLRAADAIINTELFPAATYLCRATYAGQRIGVAKFVVTH
jgi:hypothetical protein